MITPQQLVERVLRDERMTATSNPWWNNVSFTGTAPSDLTDERNRIFYDRIKDVDRSLRMRLFREAPRMLMERATFSVGPTERPFPIPRMRYLALVTDQYGRKVPVVSAFSQPELSLSKYKSLGYNAPLKDAPFRLVITRPGYWKISPSLSTETLTVNFMREHGFIDKPIWYDEGGTSNWVLTGAPVVTAASDTDDWCETLFPSTDVASLGASTKFSYASNAAPYLIAYTSIASVLPMVRAGYNLEYWIKSSAGSIPDSLTIILSKSATCATLDFTYAAAGISIGNEWMRHTVPFTSTITGLSTLGLKVSTTPVVAGNLWLDRMAYTQTFGLAPLLGSYEYNETLLPLAVRAALNADVRPDVGARQKAELEEMIRGFAANDGSGERPRRLRVRVPL